MSLFVRNIALCLAFCLFAALPARADMAEAKAAYARGDYVETAKLAAPLAAQGNREACRLLGDLYESGKGVAQNDALAWAYFHKAALGGDGEAQYRLGQIYENGRGAPQSFSDAVKWYKRAADDGHPGAKARLGKLILAGKGGKVSFNKGLSLLEEAALMGEPEAESKLAELERKGLVRPKRMQDSAPLDAETQDVLSEAEAMLGALGAPPPLGPGLDLANGVSIARMNAGGWNVILPKPRILNAEGMAWQAASLRLVLSKQSDGLLEARLHLPAMWRYVDANGRDAGRLEISGQSASGLWSASQRRWLKHNAHFSALTFSSPLGAGKLESASFRMDSHSSSENAVDLSHGVLLRGGEYKSKDGEGFSFDALEAGNDLKGLDPRGPAAPFPLKAFESGLTLAGLRLSARPGISPDMGVSSLRLSFAGREIDQPQARLALLLQADGIGLGQGQSQGMKSAAMLLPSPALPSHVKLSLAAEQLALSDLAKQLAVLLASSVEKNSRTATRGFGDTAFDLAATLFDGLADEKAQIKLEEFRAQGAFWSIAASGLLAPERGKPLPFSGKLDVTGQGLDPLVKALDEGASFLAVMLDGIRRTTPPKKDGFGNDLFELVLHADGAIDINGQRWSSPEPAKPSGKPSATPSKKKRNQSP